VNTVHATANQTPAALLACISTKDNGQPQQPHEHIALIADAIATGDAPKFPLWHYDNRKAIELWPREYLLAARTAAATTQPRLWP
jgi:hypothetical protein